MRKTSYIRSLQASVTRVKKKKKNISWHDKFVMWGAEDRVMIGKTEHFVARILISQTEHNASNFRNLKMVSRPQQTHKYSTDVIKHCSCQARSRNERKNGPS